MITSNKKEKNKIEKIDGVKWVLGMNSIVGANVPDDMIPNKYKDMLKSDNWELQFICSDYKTATDQVNAQIASINDIVKKYSKDSMVIGEAPLTKDLQDVTDVDLATVNYLSIGAIFLILMGVIDLRIPGTYIVTFVIFVGIFGHIANPDVGIFDPQYITAHLCGGGLMLGAWFMATDYVTSPITPKGQFVYGIILGVLTGLFRLFGGSAEGVSYAIIISNLLVPLIERVTLPKPFGKGGEK